MDGELVDIPVKNINTSAIRKGNEMLLLVSNYRRPDMKATIKLPFSKVIEIKDLRNNENFKPSGQITLSVPRSDIRLLYIKGN